MTEGAKRKQPFSNTLELSLKLCYVSLMCWISSYLCNECPPPPSKPASKATQLKVKVNQIISRSFKEADDSFPYVFFFFFNLQTRVQWLVHLLLFAVFLFHCVLSGSLISCLPLMKWVLQQTNTKPGQWQWQLNSYTLRAPNGLTLQFPPQREIGRTEVGIIKTTLLRKSGPFFTQRWLHRFHRQDHFLLAPCPSQRHSKMEACFPSINRCTRSFAFEGCYITRPFPSRRVSGHKFVHFCVRKRGCEYTSGCTPSPSNHWQMCNGFPVILLP